MRASFCSGPPAQYDHCPTGACASATDNTIYTPLELFSHELVHGHLAQLGLPRPWLAEGMAQLLEDTRWDLPESPAMPSTMLETTKAIDLSYSSAASFVRYLRDRFGVTRRTLSPAPRQGPSHLRQPSQPDRLFHAIPLQAVARRPGLRQRVRADRRAKAGLRLR